MLTGMSSSVSVTMQGGVGRSDDGSHLPDNTSSGQKVL